MFLTTINLNKWKEFKWGAKSYFLLLEILFITYVTITSKIELKIFLQYVLEILILFALCLHIKNRIFRLFLIPFIIINLLQSTNLVITGNYIETITLLNINEAKVVGTTLYKSYFIIIIGLIIWIPILLLKTNLNNKKYFLKLIILTATLFINIVFIKYSPLHSFLESSKNAYTILSFKHGSYDGNLFLKNSISDNIKPVTIQEKTFKDFNIILLFTEGTSLGIISPDLMPNTFYLKNNSFVFKNYYNHTAATFRGIRGQLISGYQNLGGYHKNNKGVGQITKEEINLKYKNKVESLPMILNKYGYKTIFISPQYTKNNLANLMRSIDFSLVIGNKEENILSDKQLYEKIWDKCKKLNNEKSKFFLASYIFGTHFGLDSPDLKYGNGNNIYKNKWHNQDYWLGAFLKKFKQSSLYNNTLIILTSDHAAYPAKDYLDTFKETSLSGSFVDQIPFFIYGKNISYEEKDAKMKNSLCLTPTILDLIGIKNERNHFLGTSLFDSRISEFTSWSVIGKNLYKLEHGNVVPYSWSDASLENLTSKIHKFYLFSG